MAITTTTEIAGPVNRVFQTTLLRNAKPRAPYFIGTMPGELQEHRGTFTALWRRIENLTPTTTALTEDSGTEAYPFRTGESVSVTDVTATVSKYGQVVFLTEEVDLVNFTGQTDKLIEVLGISAGRSLNRLQRNTAEDDLDPVFADAGASNSDVASPMSVGLIRSVVNTLERNTALVFTPETHGDVRQLTTPIQPAYWGICHSDVAVDIADLGSGNRGFKPVETYAGHTATVPGEFGTLTVAGTGVRFISTPEASIDADAGAAVGAGIRSTGAVNADIYTTVIYGRDALGSLGFGIEHIKEVYMAGDSLPAVRLINHGRGSAGSMAPLDENTPLAWKAWHASVELNNRLVDLHDHERREIERLLSDLAVLINARADTIEKALHTL
ncbi:hypothetical protein LCGC14_2508320, partial [marine sediment metagenome]